MAENDLMKVNIEIPRKLFDLIADMANNANEQYKTNLTAKDLVSKWVVQYFGTKNSLDVMAFAAQKYKEQFEEIQPEIMDLYNDFQETALRFDDISTKTNKIFLETVRKLESLAKEAD